MREKRGVLGPFGIAPPLLLTPNINVRGDGSQHSVLASGHALSCRVVIGGCNANFPLVQISERIFILL